MIEAGAGKAAISIELEDCQLGLFDIHIASTRCDASSADSPKPIRRSARAAGTALARRGFAWIRTRRAVATQFAVTARLTFRGITVQIVMTDRHGQHDRRKCDEVTGLSCQCGHNGVRVLLMCVVITLLLKKHVVAFAHHMRRRNFVRSRVRDHRIRSLCRSRNLK